MNAIAKYTISLVLIIYYCLEGLVLLIIPKRLRYKDVSNEIVLITGGGSGIGRHFALAFARLGSLVVLWDIDKKGNEETAKLIQEIGGKAYCYLCDISDRKKVYEVAAKVKTEIGRVTVLVNNAGIVTGKQFLDCPDEKIERTFKVNAISNFWTLKAFLPDMLESNHGHIVYVSSMAGICGAAGLSDYSASKHAVVGLEESLRLELRKRGYRGVHSTVVCPYFANTGLFEGVSPGNLSLLDPAEVVEQSMAAILINQEVVFLPKIFNILCWAKLMVPTAATFEVMDALGILNSMETFQGRKA